MMAKADPNNKYIREVSAKTVDVYDVLVAFNVTCPARAHAIKKLLCAGIRGKGNEVQDLKETLQAVERAVQLAEEKNKYTIHADRIPAHA